jgi:DNA recombination protein RmuC
MLFLTIVLAFLALALIAVLVVILFKPKQNTEALLLKQQMENLQGNVDASSKLVHQQMSDLTKNLSDQLHQARKSMEEGSRESTKVLGERLDNAARVVGEVQKSLGRMETQTKNIEEVGKDISRLNDILKAPKLRGSIGELFLSDLLAQVLPKERYETQHKFKNGQVVDAVIKSSQGLICIDSKFPLENFTRLLQLKDEEEKKAARKLFLTDVKKHVDAISQKYILPDEGTLDFAMMYVPAENVYYEIILKNDPSERDLLQYAQEKRIFPVSPNSFYAYLQTIAIGFKGLQMQEGIRVVLDNIARLKGDFKKFGEDFALIGRHLSNARGTYESAEKRVTRLGEKLDSLELEEKQELRVLTGGTEPL